MNAPTNQPESMALAATQTYTPPALAAGRTSASALMLDDRSMDRMMRVAEMMSTGKSTVPVHLRNSPGDCLAVVMQATQWSLNPFAVAQKTYMSPGGRLSYEAQLVAAVINCSGVTKDRFNFEWFGQWEKIIGKFKTVESRQKKDDDGNPKKYIVPAWEPKDEQGLGVRVWATIKGESEPRMLELLLTQVRTRNSTLWAEDPKQQIAYQAETRWSRLYAPDVILGVYTPDELGDNTVMVRDMGAADVVQPDQSPAGAPADLIAQAEKAAKAGMLVYQKFWQDTGVANRKLLADLHEGYKQTAKTADEDRTLDAAPPFPPAANAPAPAANSKGFEEVMAMLCEAKNEDALHVAADWISTVTDGEQSLLNDKYDERLATMRGAH